MTSVRERTEEEKMLAGDLYLASDPVLMSKRAKATKLCREYNSADGEDDQLVRRTILELLLGSVGDDVAILSPFRVDYGVNTFIGNKVFMNWGMIILDTCRVTIGDNVLFGPNVALLSATHPLDPAMRRDWGPELGKPITIGDDVWFGGNCTVLPGITIGNGCTIGAGSVVTRDVEPYTVVAGNPAKVLKRLAKPDEEK
ncbi:hypothetical protein PhCBS80983_g01123 [Powellomyces hirtus]|uniref:Maltose/galactoside acetyltransferase domain-containing protein n=1 Tax=Powellomyces hirtus TaxID=109895 RepID=A0A507ECI7_9FUNG|nr:hypothetical protein PhCBS80983_g01123 [Powellomyces hirtus]